MIIMDITELEIGKFYKYSQSDLDETKRGNCDLFNQVKLNPIEYFKVVGRDHNGYLNIVLYHKDGTTRSKTTTLSHATTIRDEIPIIIPPSCLKRGADLADDEEPKVFTEVPRGRTSAQAAGRRRTKKKAKKRKSLASRGTKSRP
jgi:hypothetical protein